MSLREASELRAELLREAESEVATVNQIAASREEELKTPFDAMEAHLLDRIVFAQAHATQDHDIGSAHDDAEEYYAKVRKYFAKSQRMCI